MGMSVESMFIVRSIQNKYPYLSLCSLFLCSAAFFAYCLKIVESKVYYTNEEIMIKKVDYRFYENCLWNIMVCMTSGLDLNSRIW